ncbi:MAG: class I SAM-dependent methyltransferase [Thermoplasmatales archaeon]
MNEIEDFYNFESQYYDKIYGSFTDDIVFYKSIPCYPPYLELFAGTGRIISKFKDGIGVEINFNMLSSSSSKFIKIQGDARSLPLKKVFNTVIIGLNSLLLVKDEDKVKIISEARRVLNTGGILLVDVINGFSLKRGVYEVANFNSNGLKIKLKLWPRRDGYKYILTYRYLISGIERKNVVKNITIYPVVYENLMKMIEEESFRIESVYGDYDLSSYDKSSEKLIVKAKAV